MAKKIWDERITKSTDWGGDESTGGLPVAGNRVQEFIKEQLSGKMGMFHYDETNNRYLVFADAECRDTYLADPTRSELVLGTFDAPFNYSAEISLSSAAYVAILAGTKNNYIDFTFDIKNKSGQSIGEDVICTYTFIKGGTKKTVTEKYRYGQSVHFNIDAYLGTGTNTITVGITGQNTLAATTAAITYQVIDLQLSDTYDISQTYNLVSNPAAVAAIPYTVSGYGTKVMEWYLDGTLLDYVKMEDEIVDVSSSRTKYISLANLSQGIHSLQYRAYTMMDGERFYSNILYRDLMVLTGADKNPIIAVSAVIPVGNEIITTGNLQLYGITQYIPYELTFAVHNPGNVASTDATIALDSRMETTIVTHNGEEVNYSLRSSAYGVKTLTLTAGVTVYTIGLNISKSSTSLEEITEALQLDLQALGKSNNDADKEEWLHGPYHATFSGFNWNNTSGWVNNRLLISAGTYVDINYAPLAADPTATGKTLEFEFATNNVSDDNAVISDLRNEIGAGLLITASEVSLVSAGGAKVTTRFKSGENIRIAFVINRKADVVNKGLAFIYVNGICSGAVNYSGTDNFTSAATLRIGNTSQADVELKALRFYDTALSSDQVLNNYILYRDDTSEMLFIYDRNSIYEDGTQQFSVEKLAAQCPVMIFTGDIPALENTTDKNKTIYVDIEYINMQDTSKSFTSKGTRLRPQGTSSMGYPKKNFRPYTNYGTMYDNLGNLIVDGLYAFAERSQPVNCWCLKADYAESSGSHNTGIARLWNDAMYNAQVNGEYVLRTEAQKAAVAEDYAYDVRTTVDGFPCNVFYRLTAESELIYIGKYNFNNDKSTESVFGFCDIPGFDNSRMQCWEVLNNGNHLALFQDITNFDNEWDQAYEARYPDKSTNVADLKTFSEWVVSTIGNAAKFNSEKWSHLDVYKVAAYYVYLMRFGAVDQVVKNAMLTSEDGVHWYFINYDNDTVNAVRNDGLLIYNYDIDRQSVDETFSAMVYAYAGHDSTLWNNLEADTEFMQIVSDVDTALYMAGLSYEKVIDMFDNKQSSKWCERVYNQDAQYKYIAPYTDSGTNNLFMLQGSRSAHRRWWLSRRFDLYDSKFVSGAYKSKSIEFKAANAPTGLQFGIVAGSNYYAGYGLNNVPIETGVHLTAGETHTFTTLQVINVGDPVRIYSAVNVRELDLSSFISYLSTLNISEVYGEEVGTNLKKLIMGVDTANDSRRNTSLSVISGLAKAKRLEYLDISGYQSITSLDLSGQMYFTTLKAYYSGLTGFMLAGGAPVASLELPDTMQSLVLDSLPYLTLPGLKVSGAGRNLSTISVKKCNALDISSFVFAWKENKTVRNADCSLTLDGINWSSDIATQLISLGDIKTDGGMLSVRGKVILTSITQQQAISLQSIYGQNCFNADAELYITAPESLFIIGSSDFPDSNTVQYSTIVISQVPGEVSYTLVVNDSETESYNGITIDAITGLLTSGALSADTPIIIRAKRNDVISDMNITVRKRIYPTSITITGEDAIMKVGNIEYMLNVIPDTVTGEYTTVWTISGTAVTNGYVEIASQGKNSCILSINQIVGVTDLRIEAITTTAIASTFTAFMDVPVLKSRIIMTKESNPQVLDVCNQAGWCANSTYMTEDEAKAITDIGTVFRSKNILSFDELKYFTKITNINAYAFKDCKYLERISLPENLTSIDEYAFNFCSALETIILPDSLTTIKKSAFSYCSKLSSIILPNTITNIENSVFSGCRSLQSLYLHEQVTSIEDYAFSDCSGLESVILTDGLTNIGKQAFSSCIKLKTITLPESLTSIGDHAFSGCSELETIILPNSLTSIGIYIFHICSKLKSVVFPTTLTTVALGTFRGCSALETIILPEGVKVVGPNAFEKCILLKSITFPESLITIDEYAFSECSAIESITIPQNVKYIEREAFWKCPKLKAITCKALKAPSAGSAFGINPSDYTGRDTYDKYVNRLYVSSSSQGYINGSGWSDLLNPAKCGFTISYTL